MYMPSLTLVPLKCETDTRLGQFWFWVNNSREWTFNEDYVIYYKKSNTYIYIPKGFRINGASIPKFGCNIYDRVGILFQGSIPHDFGYKYNGLLELDINTKKLQLMSYTKYELDIIFNDINVQFNNLPDITYYAHLALKYFGFIAWNRHRKIDSHFSDDFPEYLIDYIIPESIESKFCRGKK